MSAPLLLLCGLVLGALGGAGHLLVLRWRVRALACGELSRAQRTWPLGLLAPAAAVAAASSLAASAAWSALLGLTLARWLLLARLGRPA